MVQVQVIVLVALSFHGLALPFEPSAPNETASRGGTVVVPDTTSHLLVLMR